MSAKGEKYKSMSMMKKHEAKEGPAARMKEYGTPMKKKAAKKMAAKKK